MLAKLRERSPVYLVHMWTDAYTMENGMEVPQKN